MTEATQITNPDDVGAETPYVSPYGVPEGKKAYDEWFFEGQIENLREKYDIEGKNLAEEADLVTKYTKEVMPLLKDDDGSIRISPEIEVSDEVRKALEHDMQQMVDDIKIHSELIGEDRAISILLQTLPEFEALSLADLRQSGKVSEISSKIGTGDKKEQKLRQVVNGYAKLLGIKTMIGIIQTAFPDQKSK